MRETTTPRAGVVSAQPKLTEQTGRLARCGCGVTRPADPNLAFFEDRSAGSRPALEHCAHCGMFQVAHESDDPRVHNPVREGTCPGFEPHGEYDTDTFYCGHMGWD